LLKPLPFGITPDSLFADYTIATGVTRGVYQDGREPSGYEATESFCKPKCVFGDAKIVGNGVAAT
jgi:hypothetical protein